MKNRSRAHRLRSISLSLSRDWLYYTRETIREIVLLSTSDFYLGKWILFHFEKLSESVIDVVVVVGDSRERRDHRRIVG